MALEHASALNYELNHDATNGRGVTRYTLAAIYVYLSHIYKIPAFLSLYIISILSYKQKMMQKLVLFMARE